MSSSDVDSRYTPIARPLTTILTAGTRAPDFTLHSTPDQTVSLSADWSPVCGDQLALYNELPEEFGKYDAQLLARTLQVRYDYGVGNAQG